LSVSVERLCCPLGGGATVLCPPALLLLLAPRFALLRRLGCLRPLHTPGLQQRRLPLCLSLLSHTLPRSAHSPMAGDKRRESQSCPTPAGPPAAASGGCAAAPPSPRRRQGSLAAAPVSRGPGLGTTSPPFAAQLPAQPPVPSPPCCGSTTNIRCQSLPRTRQRRKVVASHTYYYGWQARQVGCARVVVALGVTERQHDMARRHIFVPVRQRATELLRRLVVLPVPEQTGRFERGAVVVS
jgi:hypothetical protein